MRSGPGSKEMNTAVTEGTRWSKSFGPGGDSLTTAPPAALTSCSTTAWTLSLWTFLQQLKAQEPFLLTCFRCNRELECILEKRHPPDFFSLGRSCGERLSYTPLDFSSVNCRIVDNLRCDKKPQVEALLGPDSSQAAIRASWAPEMLGRDLRCQE
ncbi:hypothetical protein TREES_T100000031 [Tupaia chinensis]|uniref:Uncharacterized protein n=1 Tax=Tupaia chinensis TaxID=246437 RepID=L9LD29_TUPCH|nr:hypothetical protein TREES_T100000031 [Tupaia chinensis]